MSCSVRFVVRKKDFKMKKTSFVFVCLAIVGCSGVAPEAERDDNNKLLQPPFMEQDLKTIEKKQAAKQEAAAEENKD